MGEYMAASITIGGKISKRRAKGLLEAIERDCASADWEGHVVEELEFGKPFTVYDNEASWGKFEEIQSFCLQNSIPYVRTCDGKYEYSAEREVFTGKGEPVTYTADDGDPLMNTETAKKLGSYEAVLAWFDRANWEPPALELK